MRIHCWFVKLAWWRCTITRPTPMTTWQPWLSSTQSTSTRTLECALSCSSCVSASSYIAHAPHGSSPSCVRHFTVIHMRSWCVRFSFATDLSILFIFYFSHILSNAFQFFTHCKFVDNLRISPKESMASFDEGYAITTPALVVEYIAPPEVEYIAPAPAVIAALAVVVEYITTEPALSYVAAAPTVYAAPAPIVEYARGGIHRASASRLQRGNSSNRVHYSSVRVGVRRASASRILRGYSSGHVHCACPSGGIRRAVVSHAAPASFWSIRLPMWQNIFNGPWFNRTCRWEVVLFHMILVRAAPESWLQVGVSELWWACA